MTPPEQVPALTANDLEVWTKFARTAPALACRDLRLERGVCVSLCEACMLLCVSWGEASLFELGMLLLLAVRVRLLPETRTRMKIWKRRFSNDCCTISVI